MPAGHHYSFPPKMLYHPADVRMPSQAIPYVLRTVRGALEAQGFKGVAVCGKPASVCVPPARPGDWAVSTRHDE
jgi:hypothetical protein